MNTVKPKPQVASINRMQMVMCLSEEANGFVEMCKYIVEQNSLKGQQLWAQVIERHIPGDVELECAECIEASSIHCATVPISFV